MSHPQPDPVTVFTDQAGKYTTIVPGFTLDSTNDVDVTYSATVTQIP